MLAGMQMGMMVLQAQVIDFLRNRSLRTNTSVDGR